MRYNQKILWEVWLWRRIIICLLCFALCAQLSYSELVLMSNWEKPDEKINDTKFQAIFSRKNRVWFELKRKYNSESRYIIQSGIGQRGRKNGVHTIVFSSKNRQLGITGRHVTGAACRRQSDVILAANSAAMGSGHTNMWGSGRIKGKSRWKLFRLFETAAGKAGVLLGTAGFGGRNILTRSHENRAKRCAQQQHSDPATKMCQGRCRDMMRQRYENMKKQPLHLLNLDNDREFRQGSFSSGCGWCGATETGSKITKTGGFPQWRKSPVFCFNLSDEPAVIPSAIYRSV